METMDNLKKQQFKVESDNHSLKKQNEELRKRLDDMQVSVNLNSETLKKLPTEIARTVRADTKVSALLAKRKVLYEKPKPKRWDYKIQFDNIQFNHICEKRNNTGEFYYTFMVNGDPVVDVTVNNPVKVTEGQLVDLSHYKSTTVKSVNAQETFTLSGFVKEYDGRSFLGLGRSLKVTNVGEFTNEIRYNEISPTIVIGGENNSVCKVTLKLKVTQINNAT